MLPSPEDLADLAVPAVGGREVVEAEVDEVMREEVTSMWFPHTIQPIKPTPGNKRGGLPLDGSHSP